MADSESPEVVSAEELAERLHVDGEEGAKLVAKAIKLDLLIPLGEAAVPREGTDVTLVAIGRQVDRALEAAERLSEEGISVEVVDPRTLAPLDRPTIADSIRRTGRPQARQGSPSRS